MRKVCISLGIASVFFVAVVLVTEGEFMRRAAMAFVLVFFGYLAFLNVGGDGREK